MREGTRLWGTLNDSQAKEIKFYLAENGKLLEDSVARNNALTLMLRSPVHSKRMQEN